MRADSSDPVPRRDPPERELDLELAVQVLRRRLWVVVAVAGAVFVAGALLTLRAPRIYRARATLLIDQTAPEVLGSVRGVVDLGAPSYWEAKEYYETQYAVIRSRPVAQKAAAALGLAPKVIAERLRALGPESMEARAAADPLHGADAQLREKLDLLGLGGLGSRAEMLDELEALDAAKLVQQRIEVEPVKDSQLVAIAVEDTSPERAALVANAVADAYSEYNLDQKVLATRSAVDWLSDQLRDLRDRLQASELALYGFKKENNLVSVSMEERQTMTAESLSQLNRALSETRARRIGFESRRDQVRRLRDSGLPPESIEEVNANRLVQELKASLAKLEQEEGELALRYTEEHPKLAAVRQRVRLARRELDSEIGKILLALDEELATALETERRLEVEIDRVRGEALAINKKEIEYNRLRRERDNNQALFDMVLKREKEADLTQLLEVNNVRKLEAAAPPDRPARPRVRFDLALSLTLGLLLGLVAAFVVDYLDDSVKTQAQVEQLLGLPFLGIVPRMKDEQGAPVPAGPDLDQHVARHPRSAAAECCRAIRTNLLFMGHARPARRILVTSSGPEEGKTTTVVNIAAAMAQSGGRTVVVDADMRRPRVHRSFGLDNDLGISSVILGEVPLDRAIRSTGIDNLDVVTCGPLPPNPAELMHTESFAHIVEELSRRYDRVLLDSPPVVAVADALVLARLVDGVVLVLRAGRTPWPAAQQAKRRLEGVGGVLFGAVLNDVDLDRRGGDYYRTYQYYRSGYGEQPEKAAG